MAKKRFKLTDIFSRLGSKTNKEGTSFKAPSSSGNIKKEMDWKYGHGEFADIKKRRKPGESKFDYNVRMRKEGRKTPSTKSSYQYQKDPDPKTEIKGLQGQEPLWAQRDPLGINKNPGDLREQARHTTTTLPSAPGDEWRYKIDQSASSFGVDQDILWAYDPDGNPHKVEPGSDSDKAIRKRYTGSETGDLSSWYGHDTYGRHSSFDVDPEGFMIEGTHSSSPEFERKSYLPYDLAQKKYNPKYKEKK